MWLLGTAFGLRTFTMRVMPAVAAISIRVSSNNKLNLPRTKSQPRGYVTPNKAAVSP